MSYLFWPYLLTAAWQDFKEKSISVWVYVIFGMGAFMGRNIYGTVSGEWEIEYLISCVCSMGIGLFVLAVSRFTEGKIGEGDGWFFIASGCYLNFWENLQLLLAGLFFCSLWGMGQIGFSLWKRKNSAVWRKKTMPFLPFLIPAAAWIVFL